MFKYATVNGKYIAYTNDTVFLVQVGKGPKGGYKNYYSFRGDPREAMFYFASINVGNGFKKRLIMSGCSRPVLARIAS